MEENKIQLLSEYIQLKIEAAYQKAVSRTSILYRQEYIDQLAMEIFMDMMRNDIKLQHYMQTVVNEWYNGVIQNISINDLREKAKSGIYFGNIGVGTFSTYLVYSGGYYKWNEVWHKTKTAGTAFRWESRWKKNFSVQNRIKDINKVAKYRNIAGKVTKGSGVLLVADIGCLRRSQAVTYYKRSYDWSINDWYRFNCCCHLVRCRFRNNGDKHSNKRRSKRVGRYD